MTFNTDDPFRDASWFQETLGFRFMEFAKLDHADVVVTAFVSSTPMSHDLGLVLDAVDRTGKLSGIKGRANHVAFWVDSREDVLRSADLYREAGLEIEYGPGKHGVGENLFLYVREPWAECGSSCFQAAICSMRRIFSRLSGRSHRAR